MKYQLLPTPKFLTEKDGVFLTDNCVIQLKGELDYRVVKAAAGLRNSLCDGSFHKFCRVDGKLNNAISIAVDKNLKSEEYTLSICENSVEIVGGDEASCFYGIATLKQIIEAYGRELPCLEIKDFPDMAYRGFYHDATRGRVPSLEGTKKMVDRLAGLKVNSLQLYVEHPFDFIEFKNDGKTEDQYLTVEDILEIDQYCYDNFIDFVPSLSSFGHLYHLLMKEEYNAGKAETIGNARDILIDLLCEIAPISDCLKRRISSIKEIEAIMQLTVKAAQADSLEAFEEELSKMGF